MAISLYLLPSIVADDFNQPWEDQSSVDSKLVGYPWESVKGSLLYVTYSEFRAVDDWRKLLDFFEFMVDFRSLKIYLFLAVDKLVSFGV